MTDPRLRTSDADRHRVVAALELHTAAGRLTLEEYADRVDLALAARTHGELVAVTADLPAAGPTMPDGDAQRSHLMLAFLIAGLVVAVFAVALGLAG